jgi:hypothetical protein
VVLTALSALAAPAGRPAAVENMALDGRCYRLMAQLAANDDPRVRALAMVGAQYFLGRLDAVRDDREPAPGERTGNEGGDLIRRCSERMGPSGRDFRALGERLAPAAPRA